MKTASVLFGLLTVACASGKPDPSYPLCDRAGAPACGNVGQVGRASEPVAKPTTSRPAPVPATANRVIPIVNVLLGASSSQVTHTRALARPLVDNREQIVCGNVMTKGGSQRVCRDAARDVVDDIDVVADGEH